MASEACCKPAPAAEHFDEGTTIKFGGLDAYVNPGLATAIRTSAVILISDVFGYDKPLIRELADKTAARGFFVVVPDLFHGDPFVPTDPQNPAGSISAWMPKHDATDLIGLKAVIKQLREQGVKKIGVAGFCWGAKPAMGLAVEDEPLIDSAVFCHPSLLTDDEVRSIKVPAQFLLSEIDRQVPPERAAAFKEILASKPEVESFLKIFPGMEHGWAVRYDVNVPEQVKAAHEAHDDMLGWYKKHLTV
ncbi:hypothetical protein R1sor_023680 [Riccia sorocarpa]|uniref:Dienelactone hydrolase domain-containing protein n=1 Tax=Riccia sorocarpa TaxID=122646 RepID=A0ABD3GSF8_9MARC